MAQAVHSSEIVRMSDVLLECTVACNKKRYDKVRQAYARPKLLIIDGWLNIEPTKKVLQSRSLYTTDARNLRLSSARRSSTRIGISHLMEKIQEAEAIIDRIVYDVYDIYIEYTDPANTVVLK